MTKDLYQKRFLSEGYPDLEKIGASHFKETQKSESGVSELLPCLARLIDLSAEPRSIAVVGCGPKPIAVRDWLNRGFDARGVEPVPASAAAASEFLADPDRIAVAGAEKLPFADRSQRVVVMESVLEHVDSPVQSLAECYRVLMPGGVLFVYTTNRLRFSLTGENGEFRKRFFNWFPDVVKESYVFRHLHYDPVLANYTPRPAVHWFSYTDLCKLGRQAGFAQFYSRLDLLPARAPSIQDRMFRRMLIHIAGGSLRQNPWVRAIALLQYGNSIFMLKRPE